MHPNQAPFYGMLATALEWSREYGLLILVLLLFGWLVLSWLSNMTVRVNGLSLAVGDMRQDLEEIKDAVKSLQRPRDEQASRSD